MVRSSYSQSGFVSKKLLLLFGVLVVAGVIFALEITDTTYIFHKKIVPPTIPSKSQDQKTSNKSDKSGANNSPSTMTSTNKFPAPAPGKQLPLIQPYGTFVSNNTPGQNGAPTNEQSVCSTTPGASCYIKFTNVSTGKVTKLGTQTVGSDNSTEWSWDAKTLTSGKWKIEAVATLNGETKTTQDSLQLIVP